MTKKLCMIEGREHEKYFQYKILKHESQIVYGGNNANTKNIFFNKNKNSVVQKLTTNHKSCMKEIITHKKYFFNINLVL